ncbi:hypothetical protein GCM10020369_37030 [Cryptosporangium minutisporangium]|uniref:Ig-like domain-containing protein n=1 Tax=Cryptosporangium minutisporangium TaxID=113569 RepID=A0ABP6SZV4_9ACTN
MSKRKALRILLLLGVTAAAAANPKRVERRFTVRPPTTMVLGIIAAMFASALLALVAPAPASAAVPGYEFKPGGTAFNSDTFKKLEVSCPSGKRAISSGFALIGAEGNVALTAQRISATKATITATEDQDGTTANWRISGGVLCANPLPGLEYKPGPASVTSNSVSQSTADCTPGKQLIGYGVELDPAFPLFGQVSIASLGFGSTGVFATDFEDQDGGAGNRRLLVTAVCANPLPGYKILPGQGSQVSSNAVRFDTARCATGDKSLAAGWTATGGGQTLITSVNTGELGADTGASEDDDGYEPTWQLRSSIICVTG